MVDDEVDNDANLKSNKDQVPLVQSAKEDVNIYTDGIPSCSPSTSGGLTRNRSLSREKSINNMAVAKYRQQSIGRYNNSYCLKFECFKINSIIFYSEGVTEHIEGVQDDLESLKDLLRSDEYSIDATTLLNVIYSIFLVFF